MSRTAVSKWESGRGYPSIESLKEISGYFSVSIDDLLSGEKLILLAEKENKSNIRSVCDLLFGIVDLFSLFLIVLPIYPHSTGEYVLSVSLFAYSQTMVFAKVVYWVLFLLMFVFGITKMLLTKTKSEKISRFLTDFSVGINIFAVVFLALTRQVYAVIVAFLLLITKGMILLKCKS